MHAAGESSTAGSSVPALPAWAPLVWFAALAAALTAITVLLAQPPGALDDIAPQFQRDGLLLNGPVVDEQVAGVEFGGRPVALLFARQPPSPQQISEYVDNLPSHVTVHLVLPAPAAADYTIPVVADPLGLLSAAVGMRRPVDAGRPVGYAIVDSARTVRYATLDPAYLTNGFEIATIVGAVQ